MKDFFFSDLLTRRRPWSNPPGRIRRQACGWVQPGFASGHPPGGRPSDSSGMSPPMLAPLAGSSSRVVASDRCAATAMIADQRVSQAFAAAARSQGGASATRACARARVTCRASLPQRPPTSIAKTMRRQRRARVSSG